MTKPTLQALRDQLQDSPVVEHISWKVDLPIPKKVIVDHFGSEIDLGCLLPTRVGTLDTSMVVNGVFQSDILCVGYDLLVDGDPEPVKAIVDGCTFRMIMLQRYLIAEHDVAGSGAPVKHTFVRPVHLEKGTPLRAELMFKNDAACSRIHDALLGHGHLSLGFRIYGREMHGEWFAFVMRYVDRATCELRLPA